MILKKVFLFLLCFSVVLFSTEKEKLDKVNKQIKNIENKLKKLKKKKGSLLDEIYTIELKQAKAAAEVRRVKLRLVKTGREADKKKREIKKLRSDVQSSQVNLRKALRILYKLGEGAYIKFFVRVDSFNELFKNYRFFASLINYKSEEIGNLRANLLKLEKLEKELQGQYDVLSSLRKSRELKLLSIRSLKSSKLDLIGKINSDRRSYTRLLDELKEEAVNLDKILKGEQVQFKIGLLSANAVRTLRGKLKWPLRGEVVSFFGKKKSTKFDTYVFNNGIEIKPSASAKVKAVYDGQVVFTDYFKGYGNLIIIQHAKNFYSLYGHCEEILKKKGDVVTEGDVISLAGDTGSAPGKSLYFEIRKDLQPENPLKWLLALRKSR